MKYTLTIIAFLTLISCGAKKTTIENTVPLNALLQNDSWMILCLMPSNEFRVPFETKMEEELTFHNIHSEKSFSLIKTQFDKNAVVNKKLVDFVNSLLEKGYQKLLISKITDKEQATVKEGDHYKNIEIFHFATNLYDLNAEDNQLLWSMCICVSDHQLPLLTIEDFTTAIVKKLEEDGMIPPQEQQLLQAYHFKYE